MHHDATFPPAARGSGGPTSTAATERSLLLQPSQTREQVLQTCKRYAEGLKLYALLTNSGPCGASMRANSLLCLLSLATAATTLAVGIASADGGSPLIVRPRIYIYDLPPELLAQHGGIGHQMVEQIKLSGHHEINGDKADYFWIPGGGIYPGRENRTGREFMISLFEHVLCRHPWWNMTVALGQARHVIMVLFDGGVGEAFHAKGMEVRKPDDLPTGE